MNTQILTDALNWIITHKTAIIAGALAALPTIITALSNYPKAAGLEAVLKTILNILSIATHNDSPGTLKLPGTMSKPPAGQTATLSVGNGAKVAIIIAMLLPSTGCTFMKSIAKPSEQCGMAEVVPVVGAISAGDEATIVADLGNAVECEIGVIVSTLQGKIDTATAAGKANPLTKTEQKLLRVGQAWLKAHNK